MYGKPVEVYEERFELTDVREEDAYVYYTGLTPRYNKKYLTPFKKEKTPSFVFYPSNNGAYNYQFKCYSTGRFGKLPDLLMELFNLTYVESLKKLSNDGFANGSYTFGYRGATALHFDKLPRIPIIKKKSTTIQVVTREFNDKDYEYWSQFGILKEDLEHYNIKACSEVWYQSAKTNDLKRWINGGLVYRYIFQGKYKIYNPLNYKNTGKWLSNTALNSIQGLEYLPEEGEILIITKSYKDLIVINKYLKIPSIAFQSENTIPRDKIIYYFKKRFKNIIILYDNDEPGIKAAIKFSDTHRVPYVYIEKSSGAKDCSEYISMFGIPKFIDMAKQLLKKLKNNKNEKKN